MFINIIHELCPYKSKGSESQLIDAENFLEGGVKNQGDGLRLVFGELQF